jgi:hypothetical protein
MNKLIFLLIVLFSNPLNNFGQKVRSVTEIPKLKIGILSGDPEYFKNANNYHILFDYSNLKVGQYADEQSYIEYMKDDAEKRKEGSSDNWVKKWYSDRADVFQPKFIELFNKYSGNKIIIDSIYKNQQYVLCLHTQFLEIGFNKNFTKSPTYINVIVTIYEPNSSEKPLIISMVNIIGDEVYSSYSDDYRRIEEAYAKCGKELAKYMLKEIY